MSECYYVYKLDTENAYLVSTTRPVNMVLSVEDLYDFCRSNTVRGIDIAGLPHDEQNYEILYLGIDYSRYSGFIVSDDLFDSTIPDDLVLDGGRIPIALDTNDYPYDLRIVSDELIALSDGGKCKVWYKGTKGVINAETLLCGLYLCDNSCKAIMFDIGYSEYVPVDIETVLEDCEKCTRSRFMLEELLK